MTASAYFSQVRNALQQAGNPETSQGQMAYMRHQFEFFGVKSPEWVAITKQLHQTHGLPTGDNLKELLRLCFADDHREMQYFALQTAEKALKKQDAAFIDILEELIRTKSWWDTVDWIAKLVGMHFQRYPEQILPVTTRWMDSGHLWLQRVCLIFQLRYKDKTDADLLFRYILRVAGSKEFFLQKGAGWALRQYSKTNPAAVRQFLQQHQVAPLTRREGMKYV